MNLLKKLFSLFFFFSFFLYADLLKEDQAIFQESEKLLPFYQLAPHQSLRFITCEVFNRPQTSTQTKKAIAENHRQIVLFRYPSEGLQIKGLLSFTPHSSNQPLVVVFRGGNRVFGLLDPGSEWLSEKDYLIVSSTLRGGVSEGKDEFGGQDVNDVKHLLDYLPFLTSQLHLTYHPPKIYMIGISRGGLEMILTLSHFLELQEKTTKIVALSSIFDLKEQMIERPKEMEKMFIEDFGLIKGINEKQWIAKRNPLEKIALLNPHLPFLIIQGTADNRVQTQEARHMVNRLIGQNHQVDYWEIERGNHGLTNSFFIHQQVFDWLRASSTC